MLRFSPQPPDLAPPLELPPPMATPGSLLMSSNGYPTTYQRTGIALRRGLPENENAKVLLKTIARFKKEAQSYGCSFEQYMTTLAMKSGGDKVPKRIRIPWEAISVHPEAKQLVANDEPPTGQETRKHLWPGGDPDLVYVVIRPSHTSLFEGKDLTEFPFPTQVVPVTAETTSEYRSNYVRDALKEFLQACMLPNDLPQKILTAKDFLDATRSNAALMAHFLQWLGDWKEYSGPDLATEPSIEDVKDVYQKQRPILPKRPNSRIEAVKNTHQEEQPELLRRRSSRIRGRNTSSQRLSGSDKKRKASADSITTRKTSKRGKK